MLEEERQREIDSLAAVKAAELLALEQLQNQKRKDSIARCYIEPREGKFEVNGLSLDRYFPRFVHRSHSLDPFSLTSRLGSYNLRAIVKGGGHTGQAGAIRLGIARALLKQEPELRSLLKAEKLLTLPLFALHRTELTQEKRYNQII